MDGCLVVVSHFIGSIFKTPSEVNMQHQ